MAELRAQLERLVDDATGGRVPADPRIAWQRGRRRRHTRLATGSALATAAVIASLVMVPRVLHDQPPAAATSGELGGGLAPPEARRGELVVRIEHPPAGLPSTYRHRISCHKNEAVSKLVGVADLDGIDPLNSSSAAETNRSPRTYVFTSAHDDPLLPHDGPMLAIAVADGEPGRESFLVVDELEGGLRLEQPDASRGSMAGRWKLISMAVDYSGDREGGGGVRTERPAGTERAFASWWCPPSR